MPPQQPETEDTSASPLTSARATAVAFLIILAAAAALFLYTLSRPSHVHWISDSDQAIWIQPDVPPFLGMLPVQDRFIIYGTRINAPAQPGPATLTIDVLHDQRVDLNGTMLLDFDPELQPVPGKISRTVVDIGPYLTPGENLLEIIVKNNDGPQILKAEAPALNLYTGPEWEYAVDLENWGPVTSAVHPPPFISEGSRRATPAAALKVLPLTLIIFALALIPLFKPDIARLATPANIRTACIALFILLGLNNIFRLDLTAGMDGTDHYLYINHILREHSIPLASDGLYGFRAPLFYLIAAPVLGILKLFLENDLAHQAVRFVPVLLGAALIEITRRILARIYPDSPSTVIFGTLIAAFIPVNLCMSQFVSDELGAALTGSLTIACIINITLQPHAPTAKQSALLGALLGLALLAKISTALLLLPCIGLMTWCYITKTESPNPRAYLQHILAASAAALLICGWYFIRNYFHLGQFVVAGWDTSEYPWWQPPGYRALHHYTQFGGSLVNPVFSGVYSFWDGLYSTTWADGWTSGTIGDVPDWNYGLIAIGAWLGLLPTVLIITGLTAAPIAMLRDKSAPATPRDAVLLFSGACLLLYIAAMIYIHARTPIYSAVKGSYFLAILPCLVILTVHAVQIIESRASKAAIATLRASIAAWAITAYLAYFIA